MNNELVACSWHMAVLEMEAMVCTDGGGEFWIQHTDRISVWCRTTHDSKNSSSQAHLAEQNT